MESWGKKREEGAMVESWELRVRTVGSRNRFEGIGVESPWLVEI